MANTTHIGLIDPATLIRDFETPPPFQGQVTTFSYALIEGLIIERFHDAPENITAYTAYEPVEGAPFEPWQTPPKLGDEIGPVLLASSWGEVSADDLADYLRRLSDQGTYLPDIDGLMDRIKEGPTRWTLWCRDDWVSIDLDGAWSLEDTIERCKEWLSEGEWPPLAEITGYVYPAGTNPEDYPDAEVSIKSGPPKEPKCPEGDGGKHHWSSEYEHGDRRNPGVWSAGGTTLIFTAHCLRCGMSRREVSRGSQRNPGEHDSIEYGEPDPEWVAENVQED